MGRYEAPGSPWWAKHIDALVRAWRTLYVGFILDALTVIGAGIANLVLKYEVTTQAFWDALWLLVLKSFLTALGSYLLRLAVTPKNVNKEQKEVGTVG